MLGLAFIDLDERRATQAVDVAITLGLRGMDAVIAQVAKESGTDLVSIDAELASKPKGIVGIKDVADLIQ